MQTAHRWAAACAIALVAMQPGVNTQPARRTSAFVNGRWFNGTAFVAATFYSVDGVLTSKPPAHVDDTFDLTGRFVVPPFGEAHNHNGDGSAAIVQRYLKDGIYYVKNPNNL